MSSALPNGFGNTSKNDKVKSIFKRKATSKEHNTLIVKRFTNKDANFWLNKSRNRRPDMTLKQAFRTSKKEVEHSLWMSASEQYPQKKRFLEDLSLARKQMILPEFRKWLRC